MTKVDVLTWKHHEDLPLLANNYLNPENITCLPAKEFQTITIAKLTDKANHKWKVRIWNPNACSSDSGSRLHNYRV